MKLSFITTNKHKVDEAEGILKPFGIEIEQIDMEYDENHDESIETIAKKAAKQMADELKKPIVLEDTGIFFEAYNNFPGALPKFVYNSIGYEGIFKLLEGKSRKAYFKSIVAYCEPKKEPLLFAGICRGEISEKIYHLNKNCLPYERIFIAAGDTKTASHLTLEEKNKISHRAKAFIQLGKHLKEKCGE